MTYLKNSEDLKRIERERANNLMLQMLNKNFVLSLYLNYDLLEIFSRFSLNIQKSTAIFTDIKLLYTQYEIEINSLSDTDGVHMRELFQKINNESFVAIQNSIEFENAENNKLFGHELSNNRERLLNFRSELISSVNLYASDLFPFKTLKIFEILEPIHLSKSLDSEKVKKLFESFGIILSESNIDEFKGKIQKVLD